MKLCRTAVYLICAASTALPSSASAADDDLCAKGYVSQMSSTAHEIPNLVVVFEGSTTRIGLFASSSAGFSDPRAIAQLEDRATLLRTAFLAHLPVRISSGGSGDSKCYGHSNQFEVQVCSNAKDCGLTVTSGS